MIRRIVSKAKIRSQAYRPIIQINSQNILTGQNRHIQDEIMENLQSNGKFITTIQEVKIDEEENSEVQIIAKIPYEQRLNIARERKERLYTAKKDRTFSLTQRGDLKALVKKLERKVTAEVQRREWFASKWLILIYLVKICKECRFKFKKKRLDIRVCVRKIALSKNYGQIWREGIGLQRLGQNTNIIHFEPAIDKNVKRNKMNQISISSIQEEKSQVQYDDRLLTNTTTNKQVSFGFLMAKNVHSQSILNSQQEIITKSPNPRIKQKKNTVNYLSP